MKSLYTFAKGGKSVNSAIAESLEEAMKICGLAKGDYDGVTVEPQPEKTMTATPNKRQRRAKSVVEKPTKKQRNNPGYWVYSKGELSAKLSHDDALKMIDEKFANGDLILIVGKVATFDREVRLHI